MSDSDFDFGVRVTGVDDAIRSVGRVAQANEATARATTTAARATQAAAQTTTRAISQVGTSVQQMGQRTGQTIGALGQMATQLTAVGALSGTAGAAISQLGGAVGALSGAMGPVGVALGAATLALTAYRVIADAAADVTTNLTVTIDTQAASYDELLSSIRRVNEERSRQSTLAMGLGSLEEQQAAVALQERTLHNLNETARALTSMAASEQNLRALTAVGQARTLTERRLASAREALAAAEADAARDAADFIETGDLPGGNGRDRPRRSGSRGGANTSDNEASLARYTASQIADAQAEIVKAYEERQEAAAALEAWETERWTQEMARVAAERAANEERIQQQRALADEARQAASAFETSWTGSLDEVAQAWRDARDAQQRAGVQMLTQADLMRVGMTSVGHEIADVVGGTMVGAFEQALGAWLDGSKSFVEAAEDMVKGVLKALVIESIVQAVTETARGVADLASYRYDTAALHFAAAGAWAAVGGVAGAVGAGIGAFGGAGKDGGSAASQAVTPTDASGTAQAQQPLVINVYPGGFITQRDVQAGVVDALNAAGREGMRLDPSLMGA